MEVVNILLVEDNEGDIVLAREAFAEGRIANLIEAATDGEQALSFLMGNSPFPNGVLPDMILLDINLPKINGLELLKTIKSNITLKHIPVVMLTTSTAEKDIFEAYDNYVNCYLQKPIDLSQFMDLIRKIENFWLEIVTLPKTDVA